MLQCNAVHRYRFRRRHRHGQVLLRLLHCDLRPQNFRSNHRALQETKFRTSLETESEIVEAGYAIRTEGLQILSFWEHIVQLMSGNKQQATTTATATATDNHNKRPSNNKSTHQTGVPHINSDGHDLDFSPRRYHAYTRPKHHLTDFIVAEDNEAVINIIRKCRSIALRHLPRTHRIDVCWLFEVCGAPVICMRYCNTKQQVADLMTKALNPPPIWEHLFDIA